MTGDFRSVEIPPRRLRRRHARHAPQGLHVLQHHAAALDVDQVVVLERFTAEQDYAPYVLRDADPENVVFVRGPDSEFAGEAAVFVLEDELADSRLVMLGFPIYLLPFDTGNQLGSNALFWVMEGR